MNDVNGLGETRDGRALPQEEIDTVLAELWGSREFAPKFVRAPHRQDEFGNDIAVGKNAFGDYALFRAVAPLRGIRPIWYEIDAKNDDFELVNEVEEKKLGPTLDVKPNAALLIAKDGSNWIVFPGESLGVRIREFDRVPLSELPEDLRDSVIRPEAKSVAAPKREQPKSAWEAKVLAGIPALFNGSSPEETKRAFAQLLLESLPTTSVQVLQKSRPPTLESIRHATDTFLELFDEAFPPSFALTSVAKLVRNSRIGQLTFARLRLIFGLKGTIASIQLRDTNRSETKLFTRLLEGNGACKGRKKENCIVISSLPLLRRQPESEEHAWNVWYHELRIWLEGNDEDTLKTAVKSNNLSGFYTKFFNPFECTFGKKTAEDAADCMDNMIPEEPLGRVKDQATNNMRLFVKDFAHPLNVEIASLLRRLFRNRLIQMEIWARRSSTPSLGYVLTQVFTTQEELDLVEPIVDRIIDQYPKLTPLDIFEQLGWERPEGASKGPDYPIESPK